MYSIGVILLERLAHRLPYNLVQLPMHEVARVIHNDEPPRLGASLRPSPAGSRLARRLALGR